VRRVVSQRDPARYGMIVVVGALDLVVGVLLALGHLDEPFMFVIGVVLAVSAVLMLVVSVPRFRRERRRTD